MEKNFVEFWTDLFMKATQNQKTMDYFSAWMRQGFTGMEEMTALFQKTCWLDRSTEQPGQDYLVFWEKAQEGFKQSFTEYLSLLGYVPRDEYLDLVSKYEALKEKISAQGETVEYLQTQLAEQKKAEHDALKGKVHDLVRQQADQFQQIMDTFARNIKQDEPKRPEKKKAK